MAAAPAYLTALEFTGLTLAPDPYVAELQANFPGWLDNTLRMQSRLIDARLRKRYAAPFAPPYPEVVQHWLAKLVTVECYLKRGVDPTDAQFATMQEQAKEAWGEITEAANSDTGLFDLPLKADAASPGGISKGAPLAYTETSPYVWRDVQLDLGLEEDRNRSGT